MNKINKPKAQLPKGFRDSTEENIDIRNQVIAIIRNECEKFGFKNIETPALEYTEALGKFLPDVDRPSGGVFSFQDEDDQWISMRYDLTAPLARYVAENYQFIPKPFKRYQVGSVWRNEKPGPGRYREFIQFDADAIGISNNYVDAELCVMVAKIFLELGFTAKEYKVKYSSRIIWEDIFKRINLDEIQIPAVLRAVDKLDRLGIDGVKELLLEGRQDKSGDFMQGVNLKDSQANEILDFISNKKIKDDQLNSFEEYLQNYKELPFEFDPTVVRGLEYYTGLVFEVELTAKILNDKGKEVIFGSVAGGGRYDKLIARFGKEDVPATGISIGVDRLVYAIEQFDKINANKKPLIIIANLISDEISTYLNIADQLRLEGYACEIFYGSNNLSKQLKYCDKRGASAVVIIGEDELKNNTISIKNLTVGKEMSKNIDSREEWKELKAGQFTINKDDLINEIKKIFI
ncbi:MAG: histidine--tRNA ligase [Pelagibacterales bacterium]|nr:histidine--tRNA ligase [Alphaproteobacteria bacterium]MBL6862192.1 histidine--tRNA ligase [Pelagibacterales bacterium]